jgi:intracellular sulfur oxidation DsrE/DsrF family protein
MTDTIFNLPRRSFLAGLAAAGAGMLAPATALASSLDDRHFRVRTDDKWLDRLTGKYKQVFDMPNPTHGLGLIHIRNYLKAWKDTHNLEHPQVNAVGTMYYMTIPLGLTDPMWEKYKLGEAIKETDEKTNAAATRNIFLKADAGEATLSIKGIADWPADTSVEALQQKGTLFLMCNNALNFWAMNVANATNQKMDAVRTEFLAHLVPGVVIVPAMVMAINQAQAKGCSYMHLQ